MCDPPLICYLCGKPLDQPLSRDHIPPQQFYADEIRKKHSPNLLTVQVHTACNRAYQYDEDYFVNSLAPFARGSYSGNALLHEIFRKYAADVKRGLVRKVLQEFEKRPSGLILQPGMIAKRFEGARIHRVAWKIVRGLYFVNFEEVLPEDTPNQLEIIPPGQLPPQEFFELPYDPVRGPYPGVFDYKFTKLSEVHDFNYWAMLLWDKITMIATFHDPACTCARCAKDV